MVQIVTDAALIADGEAYFAIYVDRARDSDVSIVAELATELVGPVSPSRLAPRRLSGFELPALELMRLAGERASEQGVQKILLIDPEGWLPLAKIDRYARR